MVHLVGVHHAGQNLFFGIPELPCGQFGVHPSEEFLMYLAEFPIGTRIGLESFSYEDFHDVRNHLDSLHSGAGYPEEHEDYWRDLCYVCERFKFPFEFLEDKKVWYKYNKAAVNDARLREVIHERVLFKGEGESDFDYSVKLFRCNEARNKTQLKVRRIHVLERDQRLLERIAETGVGIAICGDGHAAFWYANKDKIKREFGINFESYSTDLMVPTGSEGNHETRFTQDAVPNECDVVGNECLLRAIRLMEKGRLTEGRNPDYVGIWGNAEPSKGYFEVFLDSPERFSGTIIDCLGDARFEGEINNQGVQFVKRYTRATQTLTKPIEYKGICVNGGLCGYYFVRGRGGESFYMRKADRVKPIDLAIAMERAFEVRGKDIKLIGKNFQQEPDVFEDHQQETKDIPF